MKKTIKKLRVTKTTLRQLSAAEVTRANGGRPPTTIGGCSYYGGCTTSIYCY